MEGKEAKMIIISFGKWFSSYGRWFVRERILFKGYIWTPFCKIKLRRKNKRRPIKWE